VITIGFICLFVSVIIGFITYIFWVAAPLAIIDKRRPRANVAEVMNIIGEVNGKCAILVDDMIDTAGTIVKGAMALHNAGAREVYAVCSHGIFSGQALTKITESPLKALITTNTLARGKMPAKIKQLSVAPALAMAISKIHDGESLSTMFSQKTMIKVNK